MVANWLGIYIKSYHLFFIISSRYLLLYIIFCFDYFQIWMVVIPIQLDFCHDDEQKSTCVYILHTYIISPKCTLCRLVSRQGNARHFVVLKSVTKKIVLNFQSEYMMHFILKLIILIYYGTLKLFFSEHEKNYCI